jgi:hypothetical protein
MVLIVVPSPRENVSVKLEHVEMIFRSTRSRKVEIYTEFSAPTFLLQVYHIYLSFNKCFLLPFWHKTTFRMLVASWPLFCYRSARRRW